MNHRAGAIISIAPATVEKFSSSEHRPPDLSALSGFYYTLTPDLMRPALWQHADAPAVPVLVTASACWDGCRLRTAPWPRTATARFCDSGGFVFGRRHGGFPFTPDTYYDWLTQMRPDVAACLDLPCEAEIALDDAEVACRQRWTLDTAAELLRRPAAFHWLPIVQGRSVEQYRVHARAYQVAGLVRPWMGIGSLCRRSSIRQVRAIVATVADELPGVRFHLFGVALRLLQQRTALHPAITSLDSAAWNSRFGSDIPVFNAEMQLHGWSQRETAIRWALPRYAAKVAQALGQTKQSAWC